MIISFIQMRATRNLPRNIHLATTHTPMGTNQFPPTSTMKPTKKGQYFIIFVLEILKDSIPSCDRMHMAFPTFTKKFLFSKVYFGHASCNSG